MRSDQYEWSINMPMPGTPDKVGRRDTTAATLAHRTRLKAKKDNTRATLASNASFALRRAHKAIAELEKQGHMVVLLPPGTELPPEIAALVVRP
jgi:hypothetical protein